MQVSQIEVSNTYSLSDWKEDLKEVCRSAGSLNKAMVFLLSDSQIKDEVFLEDINNLLNVGEVPNLFPFDERAAVCEQCRMTAKKLGHNLESAQELWTWFVSQTKANLHVVLCFSPVGDAFRCDAPNSCCGCTRRQRKHVFDANGAQGITHVCLLAQVRSA